MYRGHQWIKKIVSTVYFPLSPHTRNKIGFEKYCRRLCPTHHLRSLLPITCRALMVDQLAQTRRHLRPDSASLPTAASMPGRPHCAGQPPPMLACAPSPATTRASAPPPHAGLCLEPAALIAANVFFNITLNFTIFGWNLRFNLTVMLDSSWNLFMLD
jgi:hypothetical protein